MPPLVSARRAAVMAAAVLVTAALMTTPSAAQAAGQPRAGGGYVALGDSFASGEGLAPYRTGTDTTSNRCHRSAGQSYAEVLEAAPLPAFDDLTSYACSGAATAALLTDAPDNAHEPGQLLALTPDTTTVTLTIGGNDAGFADVLADCVYSPFSQVQAYLPGKGIGCQQRNNTEVSARISALAGGPAQYGTAPIAPLLAIIAKKSPRATIYVTGYPQLFGTTPTNSFGCQVNSGLPVFVYSTDTTWIRSKTADLNAAIKTGIRKAQSIGIQAHYVDVARSSVGHGLCDTGTAWVNPLVVVPSDPTDPSSTLAVSPASFHPTAHGQREYAVAIGLESLTLPPKP